MPSLNNIDHILCCVLAFLIFSSYYVVFNILWKGSYLTHPAWMGLKLSTTRMIFCLQMLAFIGFIIFYRWLSSDSPKKGILSRKIRPFLYSFLVLSILWAPLTYLSIKNWEGKYVIATVLTLVGVATATMVLLAGCFEDPDCPWYVTLGMILLGTVCIICDGIGWNAAFIQSYLEKRPSITVRNFS
jgi:hypothetical protein